MTNQPFSIVEEDSFRALVSFGKQSPVKMPQRETIKAKIQSMYEDKRADIKRKLQGSHKGANLAKSIYDVLVSYGITTKLLAITSEHASNMNMMLKELAKMLRPEVEWNCDDHRLLPGFR
ncbi:unnamed protein product [Allacma fusca]|uniref:Uncharacterized protein n=1 Tax=Allacma fusca TaxID=39272 RepID=A0A8J2NML5_9HEXA|nr:unnamed protein product [Allacma fusca]